MLLKLYSLVNGSLLLNHLLFIIKARNYTIYISHVFKIFKTHFVSVFSFAIHNDITMQNSFVSVIRFTFTVAIDSRQVNS